MQLIEVVPMGILAQKYQAIKIGAESVAEAIEGWSRQVCPAGRIPELIEVLDFDTEEKLRAQTQVEKVYLYPAMYGGGGLARFTGIILGAALIAAAFVVAPAAGIGASKLASALLVGGITTMIMGVVNLFMPQPSLSRSQDPEASKYIGSGVNTTQVGTPIGIGGGRMMIGGHLLSVQVNAQDLVYGEYPDVPPT